MRFSTREGGRLHHAALSCFFLAACGGATNDPPGTSSRAPSETPAASSNTPEQTPGASDSTTAPVNDCASPAAVIAASGSTMRQPVGSAQRFQLVYQGSAIGVTSLRGVDKVISGSDGPFTAGKNSGYWAEVRDASGNSTFSRILQDPTRQEAPGTNGGFSNATIDRCIAKTILVDIPRSPSGSVLVIFGSAYGTQGVANEIGRFTLE
jgi:hypothetical protein